MSASDSSSLLTTYALKLSAHVSMQREADQKAGVSKSLIGICAKSNGRLLSRLSPGSGLADLPITTATTHRYLKQVTHLIN